MYCLAKSLRSCAHIGLLALLSAAGIAQTFVDVTATSGIQNIPYSTGTFGSGLCCADFDGDGDVDIVVPGPGGSPIQYFRNDGGMSFTELTSQALGLGNGNDPRPVVAADIDNDGDPDVLVGNWRAPLQLFINDGTATFTEEAIARGLHTQSALFSISFGDYDRDGWLDIYLGNREFMSTSSGEANILYRNLGNGYFTIAGSANADHNGLTYAAPFFDYNDDMWPDIICANDKGVLGVPNTVLRNNGDGTFSDVGAQINANQVMDGMGADFVDVFNDGGSDVYISDTPTAHLFLQWDPTAGSYVDDTFTYNLWGGGLGWGVNWLDYDNDGWQDLHVVQINTPNLLYRNPRQPAALQVPWFDEAFPLGMSLSYSQFTAMIADLDDDGRLDIINRHQINILFPAPDGCTVHQNQVSNANWLRFLTRGVVSNRDGLGAKIAVFTGSLRQQQHVRSGTGYLSGSDRRVHFGMSANTHADRVEITWPSGQFQVLENVPVNQTLEVVEPSFLLSAPATVGGTTTLDLSVQGEGGLPYGMVLSFSNSPQTPLPGGRMLPLQLDALSGYTIVPGNALLTNPLGLLSASGQVSSPLVIPSLPALTGLVLYATAATFDPPGFPFVRTVFPEAVEIVIQ